MSRPPRVWLDPDAWGEGFGEGADVRPLGDLVLGASARGHLVRVLRLGAGDRVVVFDGAGREADGVIQAVGGQRVQIAVESLRRIQRPAGPRLRLLAGLLKADKMEWVVQKATELGVDEILPVATTRSVMRLDEDRSARRHERLCRISREAARQSGRPFVPRLHPVHSLEDALARVGEQDRGFVLWESERPDRGRGLARKLDDVPPGARSVVLLVGPEGGLTSEEVALGRARGMEVASLGAAILRAETAALAAVTMAAARVGRLE